MEDETQPDQQSGQPESQQPQLDPSQPPAEEPTEGQEFSWQASEYVHHHKGPGWYITLFGAFILLVAILVLLQYWFEIGLIVVVLIAVLVYSNKPPRTLTYTLTSDGITIEDRHFPFTDFRSFGVLPDEDWHSIELEPAKRFRPRMSLLFSDDDFDTIGEHLELHLPRADKPLDVIDRLARYLRF